MSTTVLPGSMAHSETITPAVTSGARTRIPTRLRMTSGRHAATTASTRTAVTGLPPSLTAPSSTRTGGRTTTGSHAHNAGLRARPAAMRLILEPARGGPAAAAGVGG